MIELFRVREADSVHPNFHGQTKREFERELLVDQRRLLRGEITKHPFKSSRWKKSKDQLRIETHDKCAYCEAPSQAVAHGDVEHYRPKSIYWWLAYNYDNYLVSCQLCNQKFKSNNFPVFDQRLAAPPVTATSTDAELEALVGSLGPDPLDAAAAAAFRGLHLEESPQLVHPYFEDPATLFGFEMSDVLEEVMIVPHPDTDGIESFVVAAEEFYGLNRPELRTLRYRFAKPYAALRIVRDREIPEDVMATLPPSFLATLQAEATAASGSIQQMIASEFPFAGMIRYFESRDAIPMMEIE
ncbi:MAG: hypothetical protein AAF628_33865 [Planctomycetota bacterium]